MKRLNWDEYFMQIVDVVAQRSTCNRGRSGAITVIDRKIMTTGYVGSPPGQPHCDDAGHLMRRFISENGNESMHCIRTIHAEENTILQAAEFGIALKGATLYCTMVPCFNCAKSITRVGIVRVMAKRRYHDDKLTLELFRDAKIQLDVLEDVVEEYDNQ